MRFAMDMGLNANDEDDVCGFDIIPVSELRAEMAKIFDNIETKFEEGLHVVLTNVGVERADFCVGYFNLRKATGGKVA